MKEKIGRTLHPEINDTLDQLFKNSTKNELHDSRKESSQRM